MCFSAPASFTAGVLLTVASTVTLKQVHKPSQLVFASIPLFFAFQQITEGVLWLVIGRPEYAGLQKITTYIFLAMAQVIWPVMIPLSVLLLEQNSRRRHILTGILGAGVVVSLYYAYSLLWYHPHAQIAQLHIAYQSTFTDPLLVPIMVLYLTATLVSLMISSIKKAYILGIIIGVSFLISLIFYVKCLTSVWCFFAAVISFVVFYILHDANKQFLLAKLPPELVSKVVKEIEVVKSAVETLKKGGRAPH